MIRQALNTKEVRRLAEALEQCHAVVLTCHVRPDGDAAGSTLGLAFLLRALGKEAHVVMPDQPPRVLSFMPGFSGIVPYSKYPEYAERLVADADMLICCDFNKTDRMDSLAPVVQKSKAVKVMVDHHLDPDPIADIVFSYPEMSSASEVAFRLIAALGLYGSVDIDCATCMATGIVTDTRNLSVNCADPELYIIMYELMRKGVDKQTIVREALERKSLGSLRLQAFAIAERMELLPRHRAAIICLDTADLDRFGYEKGDTEGLVNTPLELREVTASFFLREDPGGIVKVSARSVGNYPVSKVCEENFGGGGHLQAAGGEFHGTVADCRARLLEVLPKYDKYLSKQKSDRSCNQ